MGKAGQLTADGTHSRGVDSRGRSRANAGVWGPAHKDSVQDAAGAKAALPRSQALALRSVTGSPGVFEGRRTDWLQVFQLTVSKQLPTGGSRFQGNPNLNTQAFYY